MFPVKSSHEVQDSVLFAIITIFIILNISIENYKRCKRTL